VNVPCANAVFDIIAMTIAKVDLRIHTPVPLPWPLIAGG
jgi:hypothetical protein